MAFSYDDSLRTIAAEFEKIATRVGYYHALYLIEQHFWARQHGIRHQLTADKFSMQKRTVRHKMHMYGFKRGTEVPPELKPQEDS